MIQSREFEGELIRLIEKYELSTVTDTPAWVLARLACVAIESYDSAVSSKEAWAKHPEWEHRL